jgi:nitrate/TMAO reductase-like tetraheme cytochrome c subunit
VLTAGTAAVLTVGGVEAVHYSESTEFCTLCHPMAPQERTHAMGPHSSVECGTCHVKPGLMGFVEAKWGGTKELYHLVKDTYPRPVHGHRDKLPHVDTMCTTCHSTASLTEGQGSVQLMLRTAYASDRNNSERALSMAMRTDTDERSTASGEDAGPGGIHWHVGRDVRYVVGDDPMATIDLITYTRRDGKARTFIGAPQLGVAHEATQVIARLSRGVAWQTMDCIDCHNRVGHEAPDPTTVVDAAIARGAIDQGLPYIRRDAVALLTDQYETPEQAHRAFEEYAEDHRARYPLRTDKLEAALDRAIATIRATSAVIVDPGLAVSATTYANNIGHQASPGCFRCHDGAHYEVVDGQVTKSAIASACTTCHTFPKSGDQAAAAVSLGGKPKSHAETLWVFSHKGSVQRTNPEGTTCATCHATSHCTTCHGSGVTNISHDEMLYEHASTIRKSGTTQQCAACHEPYMCATCHRDDVLGGRADPGAPATIVVPSRAAEGGDR